MLHAVLLILATLAFGAGRAAGAGRSPALVPDTTAVEIAGAGATFPYPVYRAWADDFGAEAGLRLNYQPIGSRRGLKQVEARIVTFGATDAPLTAAELAEGGLVQWPMLVGGLVPVVHFDGIGPGGPVLDGRVLAEIYLGRIKGWDDPAIVKLNPGLRLPSNPIVVVHRSDISDATLALTTYLSQVSPDWCDTLGVSAAVNWPVGIAARGDGGLAANVTNIPFAIAILDYAVARRNHLQIAKMRNRDGNVVAPGPASFTASARAAWQDAPETFAPLFDPPGAASWPLTIATFIVMRKNPTNAADAARAVKFFGLALDKGGAAAEALDAAPLPQAIVAVVKRSMAAVGE